MKVLNRDAGNAVYIFNNFLWLLFGQWIGLGESKNKKELMTLEVEKMLEGWTIVAFVMIELSGDIGDILWC